MDGTHEARTSDADKPRILMLLSRDPFAEQSGRGFVLRQRIAQLAEAYTPVLLVVGRGETRVQDGLTISFLPMAQLGPLIANTWRLRGEPLQTWLYFNVSAQQRVRQLAAQAGVAAVYVDMVRLAPLAAGLPAHVAVIVDYDDLLSHRYRQAAESADGYEVLGYLSKSSPAQALLARTLAPLLLRIEARRCAAYERELLRRADLALLTSPREAGLLRAEAGKDGPPVLGAPPVVAPRTGSQGTPGRRLFFLGNLRYAENIVALRTLADAVRTLEAAGGLPEDVKIEVIGEYAPDLPASIARAGVAGTRMIFLGRMPDLSALAEQGVFLAPITSGTGVKLKILDGMSLGCPVVTTPKGLEGLAARPNRDVIVAPDPVGVLRAAVALRDRPRLKATLARNAIDFLRRAHSAEIGAAVREAVAAAVAKRSGAQASREPAQDGSPDPDGRENRLPTR